jgi:putative molybdopterin biosynthesis protein
MAAAHVVMTVLAEGERYGYELRREIEERFGAEWRLDYGQLYRLLATMGDKGWVERRLRPGVRGPARKFYSITARGRAEVERWARESSAERRRGRDEGAARRDVCAADGSGLVAAGSDDLVLDLLAGHLRGRNPDARFSTRAVGSLAGLLELRDRRADLAGTHLLDVDSGSYNVSYVRHLLPEEPVLLVHLALREQGLLLAAGNPKRIRGVGDLRRRGIRLVNRQPGAGTRLFLCHRLRQAGIEPRSLRGYERELSTHAAVASAIAGGRADAGPGIRAVAAAWGLDFLPLGQERYDLAIPRRVFASRRARPLIEALHESSVRAAAASLAGYDTSRMGEVIADVG